MKILKKLILPFGIIVIFVSLLLAFLFGGVRPESQTMPVILGLLAFSLALSEVFISLRIKKVEEAIGLPMMYSIHGILAFVLVIAGVAHMVSELTAEKGFDVEQPVAVAGFVSLGLFAVTTLCGIFVLSNFFAKKKKKSPAKREIGIWVHRACLLALVLVFVHIMCVHFIRANTALVVLSAVYVALAIVSYAIVKIRSYVASKYSLKSISSLNPTVHELVLEPVKGKLISYKPGQYVFLRFVKSALPKQSHPFSITSNPESNEGSISLMIKESGDYTRLIKNLKEGDVATVEGPYGNFMDEGLASSGSPLVFLAGGIGITPILSIIRSELAKASGRKMTLLWGLSGKADLLLEEELKAIAEAHPEFDYHITFSKEEVEGYDYGRISQEFLAKTGAEKFYGEADFLICGPGPMMREMKKLLKSKNVSDSKIHIEEFSF